MEKSWSERREKLTDLLEEVATEFLAISDPSAQEKKNYNVLMTALHKAVGITYKLSFPLIPKES